MRRIEAVTGPVAIELLRRHDRAAEAAARAARTTVEQLPAASRSSTSARPRARDARRARAAGRRTAAVDLQALTAGADRVRHACACSPSRRPRGTLGDALLELADRLKGALGPSAVVLGSTDDDGAVQLVASLTPRPSTRA